MRSATRKRLPAHIPTHLDCLEPRTLLSGVTVITHGAEFLSTSSPGWISAMATAIRNRIGPSTAIYSLTIAPDGAGGVAATSFSRIAGPSPNSTQSTNDETILLLDWAPASNVNLFTLKPDYSTAQVAAAAVPFLTTAFPQIGLADPLAEGSIQMIGHSRGASLVAEMAKDLGQQGIWVDQVTTLDPVPVGNDPQVVLRNNVIFADNYYETQALTHGKAIAGALNVGPLRLGGAYGILDGNQHGDVHLFYQGTINLAAGAGDGSETVVPAWYPNNHLSQGTTGFYYSRLVGGVRPLAGIAASFGGNGTRAAVTASGPQWANLAVITLPGPVIPPNMPFSINYKYDSNGSAATVTWYLDTDTNPYNGNSVLLSSSNLASTGQAPVNKIANFNISATEGTYYLEGMITNGNDTTRYEYSDQFSLDNRPPVGLPDVFNGTKITGWAVDPDTEKTALAVTLNVDGSAYASMTANLSRPELVKSYGSANHGFSFDVSALTPGIHSIDIYANDTTDGTPTLIYSNTLYTNRPPTGKFASFNGSVLTGWAFDPDAGSDPAQIMYTVDGGAPMFATADVQRKDLVPKLKSPDHGFQVILPQLSPGKHTIVVYAVDTTTQALTLLGTRSANVVGPTGNKLPRGAIDSASTTLITGWAFDGNTPKDSINVRIDIDGVAGVPFLASVPRQDLKASLGGIDFGFSQPLSLSPGEHRLDVYAIDPGTGTQVLLGSRIVGSAPPAATAGAIETVDDSFITGWAYSAGFDPAAAPLIRIDIDGLAGTPFNANIFRPDVNTIYDTTGNLGFQIATPKVAAGIHTITLNLVDPLTLAVTELATAMYVAG